MKNRVSLDDYGNRSEAFEAFDDIPANESAAATFGDVLNRRYRRREMLGALGVAASTALFGSSALIAGGRAQAQTPPTAGPSPFAFQEVSAGVDETHYVADGHDARVLLRWGDPIFPDAPAFDPLRQTKAAQERQFGYNNDYVGFIPLNVEQTRGLLCVNHEYTNEEVMFPGLGRQDKAGFEGMTRELVDIEMAAHGGTVVEIARGVEGAWAPVLHSRYNRRITADNTLMSVDGPAAGSDRLKTLDDPQGGTIRGTLNNCAGGITPWGTYLMAEENFHGYFWTDRLDGEGAPVLAGHNETSLRRYGAPALWYAWGRFHDRFNIDKAPNEPNRFGWIVEVDPLDPSSSPVKHTALGRFRHEGAETTVNRDGRIVVYSGDDQRFEYVYRFVSKGRLTDDRAANKRLLADGVLSVAVFHADGRVEWRDLIHGEGPLTPENGFRSQADVMVDVRLAADLLGATPMDRPEDVQPGPDGKIFVMLTNNHRRRADAVDAANPRAKNRFGHIIEMVAPNGDHTDRFFRWSILVRCGDPAIAEVGASWHPEQSTDGWFAAPDNCAIDADGRLWIATDQGGNWARTGRADGLYGLEHAGPGRGRSKLFFRAPIGAEICGPCFTPSGDTAFLAVQHPGTDGTRRFPGFERDSVFEDPATRWPDFEPATPPRPSVMVVTRQRGGRIA